MKETDNLLISSLAIPPGNYLREVLEEFGWSQADLAQRTGCPTQTVAGLIAGAEQLTPDIARQLDKATGVPAHIWSRLEFKYRLTLALQAEKARARLFPFTELARLGLVPRTRARQERLESLRRFFGVESLLELEGVGAYNPVFRQSGGDINHEALAAWLRAGSLLADSIDSGLFDEERLQKSLPKLRALSRSDDPHEMISDLKRILKDCGVALIVIPHFKGARITGATFWQEGRGPVLMMSLRGGWADIFWFSLFHELGHILLHPRGATFIEGKGVFPQQDRQEQEADDFARKTLIPQADFEGFVAAGNFSTGQVAAFADRVGIAPGIVVGRLQHEGVIRHNRNVGRVRYKWATQATGQPA